MSLAKFFAVLTAATALSVSAGLADPPQDDRRPQKHDSMQGQKDDRDHAQHQDSMQGPSHDSMQGRDSMRGPNRDAPNRDAMGPAQHGDRDWRDDRGSWHRDHDRYWRPDYRGFAPRDRVFGELRRHQFMRFDGAPYWFQGRYVVKSFDRQGRRVFVEINPYTGIYIGVVRF